MILEGVGNLNLESPQLTIGHAGKKEVARGGKNAAGRTDRNYNVNDSCSWAETPVGDFVKKTKLIIYSHLAVVKSKGRATKRSQLVPGVWLMPTAESGTWKPWNALQTTCAGSYENSCIPCLEGP